MIKNRIMSLLLAGAMTLGAAAYSVGFGAGTALTAEAAAGVDMWFDHVSAKTEQADTSSTGMTSYHMYMAKNEIEGCQFFVAPSEDMMIGAEVTDFVNADGDVLETELFFEYYFTMKDADKTKMPDAIPPMTEPIEVKAGTSQGFYFKTKTAVDSAPGDYTATVTVTADGETVNSAQVTLTVWDFTLTEETPMATAIDISGFAIYSEHQMPEGDDGELYRIYYDFMLENRIASYTLPYDILDERVDEYLDDPRVTSFMIGGDYNGNNTDDASIKAIYEKLSKNPEWFDKGYFYYVDEPTEMGKLNQLKAAGEKLETLYPGYRMISPFFFNIDIGGGVDQFEFMSDYLGIWCTKVNAWTPVDSEDPGAIHMMSEFQVALYGDYASRVAKEVEGGDKNWVYYCWEPIEPYTTFDASHDPIEQRVAMWQAMDNDVTGLLYFTATEWTTQMWRFLDKLNAGGQTVYGDGILIYPGYKYGVHGPISSLRLESVRDGIEDYMYLDMAKELVAQDLLSQSMYDEIMDIITVDVLNWCSDSDVFYNTRVALGNLIESQSNTNTDIPGQGEFKESSGFIAADSGYVGGAEPGTTVLTVLSSLDSINGVNITRDGESLSLTDTVLPGDVMEIINGTKWTIIIKGSVNGDGKINLADASAILKHIAKWEVDVDLISADVNSDTKVNLTDVSMILKRIAGWDVQFDMTPVVADSGADAFVSDPDILN